MSAPSSGDTTVPDGGREHVDWLHWTIVVVVFGSTGTLSALSTRFLLSEIVHLEGSLWSGPLSYQLGYLLLLMPLYSVILVTIGSLLGKHAYFRQRVLRMWGHVVPRGMRTRG